MAVTISEPVKPAAKEKWVAGSTKSAPKSWCISRLFFSDVSPVIDLAARRGSLELTDVWSWPVGAEAVLQEFLDKWSKEQAQAKKPKLRKAMWRTVSSIVYVAIFLQGMATMFKLIPVMLLYPILRILELKGDGACEPGAFAARLAAGGVAAWEETLCEEGVGIILGCGLALALLGDALCNNHCQLCLLKASLKVRGAMIGAVYSKTLKLSSIGMSQIPNGSGMLNQIVANDTEQILNSTPVIANVFFAPVLIAAGLTLLARLVGASFLGGFAAMLLVLYCSARIMGKMFVLRKKQLVHGDKRVKLTNEVLGGVRIVKAYGWEVPYEAAIMQVRWDETSYMRKQALYIAVVVVVIISATSLLAVVTFSIYTAVGNTLTPATVFTALASLNLIRFPMAFLPFGLREILNVKIAMDRLQVVLEAAERVEPTDDPKGPAATAGKEQVALRLAGEFGYPLTPEPEAKGKGKGKGGVGCLGKLFGKGKGKGKGKEEGEKAEGEGEEKEEEKNKIDPATLVERAGEDGKMLKFKRVLEVEDFEAVPGGLTMVVGPVGSGKSSLLAAVLGEAETLAGAGVARCADLAYAAQIPWIFNATVEENIRFAAPDRGQAFYEAVLKACAMESDLEGFPAGDQTEIGERGINLSGGQRARVAMARAVYRDAGLYLFDDPLAAVDAHVGKQLFSGVMGAKGILKGRTRILITHQVQYLPSADRIIVIDGGKIVAKGTYAELQGMNLEGIIGEKAVEFARQASANSQESAAEKGEKGDEKPGAPAAAIKGGDGTLVMEERKAEGVVGFKTYKDFFVLGFGVPTLSAALGMICINVGMKVCVDFWLAYWTWVGDPFGLSVGECIAVYFGLVILAALGVYIRSVLVMGIGLVRASRNLYKMLLLSVMGSPTVFFDVTPTGRLLNRFTADVDVVDNQLPRTVGQTTGVTEMLLGLFVGMMIVQPIMIIAILPCSVGYCFVSLHYRHASRDVQRLEAVTKTPIFNRLAETINGLQTVRAYGYQGHLTDMLFRELNDNQACNLLKLRIASWLALRLECLSCLIITVLIMMSVTAVGKTNAALVGVALTYGLELPRYIQAIAKSITDIEQKFTSAERILEYCALRQEAQQTMPEDLALAKAADGAWPSKGGIEYRGVAMRYRPELEPALRGLTFSVGAGEKLGIVGRTGSGKSSIIVTLLRMTEVESGQVLIDGQDLRNMGLNTLRKSLAYIPQEPVLFGQTNLRENLDPFREVEDSRLMEVLTKAGMNGPGILPEGLQTMVEEGGAPFSVGQRQLLCLARAVLRKSKILLLDEATASVDNDTDRLIQTTIREMFADATVLCIAHRIRTILDSDKVLVMDQGTCKELGTPDELLSREGSVLRALAVESNLPVPPLVPGPSMGA